MKKHYFFISCAAFLFNQLSFAQDTIVFKNGYQQPAKVVEITPEVIKYKQGEQSDSTSIFLPRDSILIIKYANGKIDSIENKKTEATIYYQTEDSASLYWRGRNDAKIYYKPKGVFWGTFMAASPVPLIFGPVVWPVAAVTTGTAFIATSPQNIIVPDERLLDNPHYMHGYIHQARKKRVGNVFGGIGLALGVDMVFVVIVLSSLGVH